MSERSPTGTPSPSMWVLAYPRCHRRKRCRGFDRPILRLCGPSAFSAGPTPQVPRLEGGGLIRITERPSHPTPPPRNARHRIERWKFSISVEVGDERCVRSLDASDNAPVGCHVSEVGDTRRIEAPRGELARTTRPLPAPHGAGSVVSVAHSRSPLEFVPAGRPVSPCWPCEPARRRGLQPQSTAPA